jgi:hypothetical protein
MSPQATKCVTRNGWDCFLRGVMFRSVFAHVGFPPPDVPSRCAAEGKPANAIFLVHEFLTLYPEIYAVLDCTCPADFRWRTIDGFEKNI